MKKILLLSALFFFLFESKAQYSLGFCEDIDNDGQPQRISNTFSLSNVSAIKFFVKADNVFDTEQVKFTIYYINSLGNEEELASLSQDVERGWNYVWKEVKVFDPGTYRVKAYNAKGSYLTSANVFIKAK
jgi:hypothetical protein